MKKHRYYIISCLVLLLITDLTCLLDNLGIISLNFNIFSTAMVIASIVIGNLSPTNKLFDYALPVVSVISYQCQRFICGFFAKTDLETRFSIFEAISWVTVDTTLLLCAMIAVATFLASFKPIRILNILKFFKRNKKC